MWPFWQDIVFFKSESGAGYPSGPFLENTITTYIAVNAYKEIWAQAGINWHIWPSRHPTDTKVNRMTTNHCQVMAHEYIKLGNDVSWKETHKKYRHPIHVTYSIPNTSPIAGQWQGSTKALTGQWQASGMPVVGQFQANDRPMTGQWQANVRPMTGQWQANDRPMTGQWQASTRADDRYRLK